MASALYEKFYAAVRRIPKGRVATYGQIAKLAGYPRHARHVGFALNALTKDDVPWHRVINSQGRVSARAEPLFGFEGRQRLMLEREKVRFGPDGRVPLEKFQWKP